MTLRRFAGLAALTAVPLVVLVFSPLLGASLPVTVGVAGAAFAALVIGLRR